MAERDFLAYIERGRQRHGATFIAPTANELQRRYFGEDQRVEVTTLYKSGETFVRRGRISGTTGWMPALLLIHRRGSSGSWDTLDSGDKVTAWIDSRGRRHPL